MSPAELRTSIQRELLENLGGPLVFALDATNYVDLSGKFHERIEVEVPIYPHPGRRNFGQGKFTDYESRRSFMERIQGGVIDEVTLFTYEAKPGSVDAEGHVLRLDSSTT